MLGESDILLCPTPLLIMSLLLMHNLADLAKVGRMQQRSGNWERKRAGYSLLLVAQVCQLLEVCIIIAANRLLKLKAAQRVEPQCTICIAPCT